MNSTRSFCLTATAIAIGWIASAVATFGAAFTVGDLVVTQIGATSGPALTKKGTATFLDEFPAAGGAMVQQLTLPTTASGLSNPLTIGGTAGSEGELSLSENGQYLVLAGYDVGVGATTQTTSTVALIDNGGNINTSTTTDLLSGNNTRGAASIDGNEVWLTGPNGLVYETTGSSSGTNLSKSFNFRALSVVPASLFPASGGALLASSNKTNLGVNAFTPALPTAPTSSAAVLAGMNVGNNTPDTYGFVFVNPTTLFVADANLGLQEWTQTSGVWSNVATLTGSFVGLTGVQNGSTVNLYATTGTSAAAGWVAGNSLISDTFTFNSGSSGPGTFGTETTLAVADTNSAFSGVAFAPAPAPAGNATIDNSGSGSFNGSVVNSPQVNVNASYAGVFSTVSANLSPTTVGGPVERTTATILAGNNSGIFNSGSPAIVSMTWRNRTLAETPLLEGGTQTTPPLPVGNLALISDVVNLYGMSSAAGSSESTAIQTDPFVLQMTFDPTTLQTGDGETQKIAQGRVFLAWLNPNGAGSGIPQWEHANTGDFGGTISGPSSPPTFIGSFLDYVNSLDGNPDFPDFTQSYTAETLGTLNNDQLDEILGAWGVDGVNQDAWAVVNHNSEFAVVPEPSAFVLAAFGLLAGVCARFRRRLATQRNL